MSTHVSPISPEHLAKLGRLADTADNLAGASKLPMRAEMHVEQLRSGLERMSKELKALYVAMSGDNPWEEGA